MTDDHTDPCSDELVGHNANFAASFAGGTLQVEPTRRLAVVACMDSRIDTFQILGLKHGEAHIIRNAGGVITDDVIRSLCLSQQLLGTREILLLHHTDCGLQKLEEDSFKDALEVEVGSRPPWALESFSDPYENVRLSVGRLRATPFVQHKQHIRGFVYDVVSGKVHPVSAR